MKVGGRICNLAVRPVVAGSILVTAFFLVIMPPVGFALDNASVVLFHVSGTFKKNKKTVLVRKRFVF